MNLDQLKQFAITEVQKNRVKLHSEDIKTILYFLETHNICQLNICVQNAYYTSEKIYFINLVNELEQIIEKKTT